MPSGRGRRRGPAGSADAVRQALEAWRAHSRGCWQCHAAAGHPAGYCAAGWELASAVSRERAIVRAAAQVRARSQGGLW